MPGTSDRRAVWPFEDVDLGPDLTADVPPGTDVDGYPRTVGRLFYRNRDLAAIEDDYGSLTGMEKATAERPAQVLPHLLWLGLRHDPAWQDEDRVADLHGSAVWGVDTQVAVARALAKALGGDADDAETETRRSLDGTGGVKLADPPEDDRQDPPEAVAEAG
jgi:hypothetical protein